ncbi:MAG: hypothetical protein QW594_00505 [Candidatus Woesearchaeota archaeon]
MFIILRFLSGYCFLSFQTHTLFSTSSIVLASASTRSFRLGMCALFYISLGPRMGQVPLSLCKARTSVAF